MERELRQIQVFIKALSKINTKLSKKLLNNFRRDRDLILISLSS